MTSSIQLVILLFAAAASLCGSKRAVCALTFQHYHQHDAPSSWFNHRRPGLSRQRGHDSTGRAFPFCDATKRTPRCRSGDNLFMVIEPTSRHSEKNDPNDDEKRQHPMSTTSRLSHIMLRVPDVNRTVQYWTNQGAILKIAKTKDTAAALPTKKPVLVSAFVQLGNSQLPSSSSSSATKETKNSAEEECFALELVRTEKENYNAGNVISYIGVSMLLQFRNSKQNLLDAVVSSGNSMTTKQQEQEPNGIPIKQSASAPGDLFARFALKSKDLTATQAFYTNILGMTVKAADETMLCLRYDGVTTTTAGVSTTLVFDRADDDSDLVVGDCFDHLAIFTSCSTDDLYASTISNIEQVKVFMQPTEMFGKKVFGVFDPNGYKVVIAGV